MYLRICKHINIYLYTYIPTHTPTPNTIIVNKPNRSVQLTLRQQNGQRQEGVVAADRESRPGRRAALGLRPSGLSPGQTGMVSSLFYNLTIPVFSSFLSFAKLIRKKRKADAITGFS